MDMSPKDGRDDMFYLQPLQREKHHIWYSRQPIGANTLATFTREACQQNGLTGYYTNHSLRATTATRLFTEGVVESTVCIQ